MRSTFASGCLMLIIALSVMLLSGCFSVPADSDIPWNEPQSWEGSPYIPGFSE